MAKGAEKAIAKARTKDSMQAFSKLTHEVDGEPRIIADPPLIVPIEDLLPGERASTSSRNGSTRACASTGARSTPIAVACSSATGSSTWPARWSGVGSVGTRAWIVLMLGRDDQDPLFLQFKEAQPSVLEAYAGRSDYRNAGHRVVSGQRLMQASGDVFLGWAHVSEGLDGGDRDFYIRQLRDWKGSADIETMVPEGMKHLRPAVRLDAGSRARPLRRPRSPSPPTSAGTRASTGRSPTSPARTPTRTSATTPHSVRPSPTAGSRPRRVCDANDPEPRGGPRMSRPDRRTLPIRREPFRGVANKTLGGSQPDWEAIGHVDAPDGAPNVLLVLIDDAGFGNAGTFGGPIDTPNYTRIAQGGLRYNRFHVTALCSPTRAALLTGRNSHAVGFGSVGEFSTGFAGYTAFVPDDCVPFPRILRDNGYSTAAFGKWHLTPDGQQGPAGPFDRWPVGWGFDYFYGFLGGGSGQWDPCLTENQKIIGTPAAYYDEENPYYLPDDMADKTIDWLHAIRAQDAAKPFFAYFSTGCSHAPHHVSEAWAKKYAGKFDQGWDALREETFARQKALGVVPGDAELTARDDAFPAWADSRTRLSRRLRAARWRSTPATRRTRTATSAACCWMQSTRWASSTTPSSSTSGATTAPAWRAR